MVSSEDEGKWSFTFSSDEHFYNKDNEHHWCVCVCVGGKERNVVLISLNDQQIVFQFLHCMQV